MPDPEGAGLPRPVAIAWGLLAEPTRGPARGVSHAQIVESAIEIADGEGIAAVTMSRVARAVGFSTMALYRYVESKDELLLLMLDAATSLPQEPFARVDGTDWRERVRRWVDMLRQVYRAHPWALEVVRGPVSVLMPSSVSAADLGLQAVATLRLDDQERVALILALSSYASAFAELERDLARQDVLELGPEAMAQLGTVVTADRWPALAPLILGGMYAGGPARDQVPAGQADADADVDVNDIEFEFRWGLERLLDGIEQLHERRGEPGSGWAGR